MVIPKMKGGLEKVDVGLGHLIIRHPETQELRIVHVAPEEARDIRSVTEELGSKLHDTPIQDWMPNLDESIKDQILTGRLTEELEN